jgi:hypothetical protein
LEKKRNAKFQFEFRKIKCFTLSPSEVTSAWGGGQVSQLPDLKALQANFIPVERITPPWEAGRGSG